MRNSSTRSMGLMASVAAAVAVAALWTVVCQAADGKIAMQLRLKEGQTYSLRMLIDQKINQTIQGQQMDMDQTMGMGVGFIVDKVQPDGAQEITLRYDWVKFKQAVDMGATKMSTDYDSANPPATIPPVAQGFAALVGLGFKMSLGPDGAVKSITGISEMINKVIEKLNLPAGVSTADIKTALEKQFGDENMRQNIAQMIATYPKQPVGIGESWTQTLTITMMGSMVSENTYTLKEISDGIATIALNSKITPGKEANPLEMAGSKMSYSFEGTQEGTTQVDIATGWTVGGSLKQDLSGTITMEQGGTKQTWPIKVKSDITINPKPEAPK